MLKVGLTGGIGSGKSTVAHVFELLGIPVYYADAAAKEIMNTDAALKEAIKKEFGEETYKNDTLDRSYLASIVFKDKVRLEQLNSLVHPATIRNAESWMQQQTTPYAIKEAALFFEAGSAGDLDYIIGVYTPKALRIQRTMLRDNTTKEEVEKRMKNQLNEEIKMRLCDYVIKNDEQQLVIPQVLALHEQFLQQAKTSS